MKQKKITYKEVIEFLLPESWIVEEDLDGNSTFMFPINDSSIIVSLNLFQTKSSKPLSENTYLDLFESFKLYNAEEIIVLESGDRLTVVIHNFVEDGNQLKSIHWLVANFKYPNIVRLAKFSFTMSIVDAEKIETLNIIGMLDKEIRNSKFT